MEPVSGKKKESHEKKQCIGKGNYCLNRTKPGGNYVGESKCEWTLSSGMDCYETYCRPYNCFRYRGKRNQTYVKLRDNTWVERYWKKGWFKDSLLLACQRDKNTSENHVIKVYQWAWQHSNGTRTYFSKFWSTTNRNKCNGGCNCKWYLDIRAFEFNYYDHYGAHSIVGEVLGSENIIYYEKAEDNET